MTLPVLIRRAAELDLERIGDWYDGQQPSLGYEFREAVDAVIARISDDPLAYSDRHRGARRALLRRFPYALWSRVLESFVVVLACVHGKRDPRIDPCSASLSVELQTSAVRSSRCSPRPLGLRVRWILTKSAGRSRQRILLSQGV
ncbi:MAG TPA: hypothetical protein DDZ42_08675 [Candidatus Rokubacteria bacterium]|nr:hypothetical protein [Candidatus Rokubacteria bacterium]